MLATIVVWVAWGSGAVLPCSCGVPCPALCDEEAAVAAEAVDPGALAAPAPVPRESSTRHCVSQGAQDVVGKIGSFPWGA